MTEVCPYICSNKTDYSYCKTSACINPTHRTPTFMVPINKELLEMSQQPWFPIIMRELSYDLVKHGYWEFIGATTRGGAIINRYACSECGYEADTTNYCPNCGAKMDGGTE